MLKVHFHKVRIKPAKPILFGTYKEGKGLFFGIPGNPVSCAIAFDIIVKPALLKIQSVKDYMPINSLGKAQKGLFPKGCGKKRVC